MRTVRSNPRGASGGFTLIELLAVIGIIAVLAGLLLPALGRAKSKSQQIACLNNHRQLQICWLLYIDDFNDALPPNATLSTGNRQGFIATTETWINGNAWTDPDSQNIERGVLFAYNRSTKIYKCPADRSTVMDLGKIPRSRSVSMNSYMNDQPDPASRFCWHKYSEIRDPAPSKAFVFLDEHENSIENARFTVTQPGVWRWIDFPAARHNNGCVLSFADGHAETWRWLEPRTLEISKRTDWIQGPLGVAGTDRDLLRIHAGVPKTPIR